jgi:hypothetical protein
VVSKVQYSNLNDRDREKEDGKIEKENKKGEGLTIT